MTNIEQFPALGTTAVVAVTDPAGMAGARGAVERTVAAFDMTCSRFRDDSELMEVNRSGGSPIKISLLLFRALEVALRAARITDGAVDPTVGAAMIAIGYDRDFADLRPVASLKPLPVPGWRAVTLDPANGTVRVPAGITLDLGATAKALAADSAAAVAAAAARCGVLVSLGGDIAVAGEPPEDGWPVRVTDDHAAGVEAPGQWITIRSGGLATSSTMVRRWQAGSGTAHHLVDPGTGLPVAGRWRTATVTAGSCVDANIASTAAIVFSQGAEQWLESCALPSRLVSVDGHAVHLAGWPVDGDDLAPTHAEAVIG